MTNLSFDILWRDHGAERGLKNLGDHSDRARRAMNGLKVAGVAALAAVGVAAAGAARFGVASVKAYADAQQSQLRLQEAFRKFPKLADTNQAALQRLNTELAKKTKFDDDATASGQAVLAQFNLTGKQITQLTPLLQDYAAKTGKDLPTAARDLGKAVLGQGRALKNVGLNFKDTGDAGKNLEQITKGLRKQVGGFAEKEGRSAAGQAEILKNQYGEIQEAVGAKLLPLLVKLGRWVSTHQEDLLKLFFETAKGAIKFGIALAKVASAGLKGFALLADGIGHFTAHQVDNMARFLHAATIAFAWVPDMGPKLLAADIKFGMFAAHARGNINKTGDSTRGFAAGIDNKLIPSLQKAGRSVDDVSRKEIVKAHARDQVNKAAQAVRHLDHDINNLNSKTVDIHFSTNAYKIGHTKFAVNLNSPSSVGRSAAGGLIRGPGSGTSDSILGLSEGGVATSWVSNGEYVVNARQTRKHLDLLEAINGGQDILRRASGGLINARVGAVPAAALQMPAAARWFETAFAKGAGQILGNGLAAGLQSTYGAYGSGPVIGAGHLARAALAHVGDAWTIGKCLQFVRMMAGAPGGTYDASVAWANARYKHPGDRNPPSGVPVYWGGGHGHIAAAVGNGNIVTTDFPHAGRIGLTTIGRLTSAWGKPYRGWANDVNGVVTSHYGLRRNRGFSSGGMVTGPSWITAGENGPERVLSAQQTRNFDRMVRVMDSRGPAGTTIININAPNYVGSREELRQTLVDMNRRGQLEVIKR